MNGPLCSVQIRESRKLRPEGREYARFEVARETERAKFALWAKRRGGAIKLYVIPLRHFVGST
jgi:hypothetical protein